MTLDVLLVGPLGQPGGERAYMETLRDHPPDGVSYAISPSYRSGATGADPAGLTERLLNRVVRPRLIPDMGFRALRVTGAFDAIHVHAHPVRLTGLRSMPVVMSEGSSSAVYLGDYLGWSEERMDAAYRRTRRVYSRLGIRDRLLAMERVRRVYVFSHWARDVNLRWGADPDKLDVVYPGFPTPAERNDVARDTFTFLFAGMDFQRKGGHDVVEAFAALSEEHPNARLLLVAPHPGSPDPDHAVQSWVSPERRTRTVATLDALERRGVARRLEVVPRDRMWHEVYPGADAFVMPTLAEGFGFTNVEAMSFGLPVISSDIGPVREVVEDGVSGLLVEPGDIAALATAMATLAAEPKRARELGTAGRARFLEDFTLERFRERLRAFYERALA